MNCIGRHFPPVRAASSPEGCEVGPELSDRTIELNQNS